MSMRFIYVWVDLFIRRSLQATYNNLFYRMDFIVLWSVTFCTGFSFAELRWTQQYRSQR